MVWTGGYVIYSTSSLGKSQFTSYKIATIQIAQQSTMYPIHE